MRNWMILLSTESCWGMWEVASGARAWHHTFSRSARRQYWRQALELKFGASLCLLAPISPHTEPEICVLISTGFFVLFARSYILIEFFLTFLKPICVLHMDITLWEFMLHLPDWTLRATKGTSEMLNSPNHGSEFFLKLAVSHPLAPTLHG